MNKKLYAIDSTTFVFGLALLFAAKGFGNLSTESGYAPLRWGFLAVLVLFSVVSNIFYYRNTIEAEIAIGNVILPLVFCFVFVGIYFNPFIIFNRFPSEPMTANMLIRPEFPAIMQSPINSGAIAMLAGLIIVPVVSAFTPAPDKNLVDNAFACYDKETTVPQSVALGKK